jgi:hypothetical protein
VEIRCCCAKESELERGAWRPGYCPLGGLSALHRGAVCPRKLKQAAVEVASSAALVVAINLD